MLAQLKLKLISRFDMLIPILIAVFAATLAINDLFGGKYGDEELQTANLRNNAYQWYQSKGLKETLTESQGELIKVLLQSGTVAEDKREGMQVLQQRLDKRTQKLKAEKKEILLGSATVGEANWVQDIEGRLGQVVGAKELESKLVKLGRAGDMFNLASMLFQITIVLGSISLLIVLGSLKWSFFIGMMSAGIGGVVVWAIGMWFAVL